MFTRITSLQAMKHRLSKGIRFATSLLSFGSAILLSAHATDTELTNFKSGIDVIWGGVKGADYAEEYFYHDKLIDDHKVVYLRDSTPISMQHNDRNVAFGIVGTTGRMQPIGANGLDGIPNSGDEGVIRYKLDRDQQYFFKWADNTARTETSRVLPAYQTPFSLASLNFEPNVPVVGSLGPNAGQKGNRSSRYFRGCVDPFGDEWHVLAYADDDSEFQRAKIATTGQFIDQAWYCSDGKTVLIVVNPKTPCLTVRSTGAGQFYTTKPKAYFTPTVHAQTTYFSPGGGTVTFELRDIYGHNVFYRIVATPEDNTTPFTTSGTNSVTLTQDSFPSGDSFLQYYYAGKEGNKKTRKIVKNPSHPSKEEPHGEYLWKTDTFPVVRNRLARDPYQKRYTLIRDRADFAGHDLWDANALRGTRFNGSVRNLTANSHALNNAFVARVEGWSFVRPGGGKSHGQYAKEMLLDHPRTIDTLGFEMLHTSDAIPSREVHYRGYYDASPVLSAIFAYDIMAAHFRSDQVAGGLTAIEDYFVRDIFAGFAYEAMQWAGDMCALREPGMWGVARMMTASHVAMVMRSYSTPYFGTSGFGSPQATYSFCPFEDDRLTWKRALFDTDVPRSTFPNYTWGLGLSDNDPASIFLAENQSFGGTTWPFATWRNKASYFSAGLMGRHLMVWANMVKRHGGGKTDPRLELGFQRAARGDLFGATSPSTTGLRDALILLQNSYWPKIVEANFDWIQSLPESDPNSIYSQLQGVGVFGFAWYDDEVRTAPGGAPSAPRSLQITN